MAKSLTTLFRNESLVDGDYVLVYYHTDKGTNICVPAVIYKNKAYVAYLEIFKHFDGIACQWIRTTKKILCKIEKQKLCEEEIMLMNKNLESESVFSDLLRGSEANEIIALYNISQTALTYKKEDIGVTSLSLPDDLAE